MRIIITMLAAVMILSVVSMGLVAAAADKANEQVIIGFNESLGKSDRESLIEEHGGKVSHAYGLINAAAARIPPKAMVKLKKNPNVKYVEYDYIANATVQTLPWGVDRIGAPVVHEYNKGSGVKVAIIDTGIDYDHPDLHDNYIGGIDYVNDDDDPMDDHGHGTHCAGIVAASDNNMGVIGVAPGAWICGVKVMSSTGSGSYSDIIAGIEWSVNNSVQIISMSLGGNYPSQALQDACDTAQANGVLLVAAAGNDGWWADSVDYPARYASVIAVAATDSNDNRPYWSSQGHAVELAAPGVGIYSTYWDNTYTTKQGTSMACPHVAGTAALVLAYDPTLSNIAVRARLQTTADDLGAPGRDTLYGFGLVNAAEAAPPSGDDTVGPVTSGVLADPNPTSGTNLVTLTASINDFTTGSSNIAEAEYFVDTVGADGDGISMNPSDSAFDSPAEDVTADIDVSVLSAGNHILYVHGKDAADNWGATESVILEVTAVADTVGPVTSGVLADPNPTSGTNLVTLTASINDFTTGSSNIAEAEYFVDTVGADGDGISMNPSDSAFDSPAEDVTADIDVSVLSAGNHILYVHGKDAADNWGATESVILEVTGAPANTMHVDGIDMALNCRWILYYATAMVTIVDATNNPVEGATVAGHWEDATSDHDSGVTTSNGQTPLLRSNVIWTSSPSGTTFTFVVDNVAKEGCEYNPSANEETEGSITVP